MTINPSRWGFGVVLAAVLLLLWLSAGVGIIGKDGDPANRMYVGVVAIGAVGALVARFRARGMARTAAAMALAQAVVGAIAVFGGLGRPWSGPAELVLLNGFFIAMFAGAAWLYRRAAENVDFPARGPQVPERDQ